MRYRIIAAAALTAAVALMAGMPGTAGTSGRHGTPVKAEPDPPIKRVVSDSVTVINTTSIGKRIIGYSGPTPVEIYLVNGTVSEVKALPNSESPGYFWSVVKSGLLSSWNGLTPKEGRELKVDAVSGATFSSDAVIQNVREGLRYAE